MKFLLLAVLLVRIYLSSASSCSGILDLGVAVDVSGSVGEESIPLLRTALRSLVNISDISSEGTHMGMIVFGGSAKLRFNFSNSLFHKPDALDKEISNINIKYGGTATYDALSLANNDLFTAAGGDRPDKPNVLLVFTDGKPTKNKTKIPDIIQVLESKGVLMVAVGIGDVDTDVLQNIAGQNGLTLSSPDFTRLSNSMQIIKDRVCALINETCSTEMFSDKIKGLKIIESKSLKEADALTSTVLKTCRNVNFLLLLRMLEDFGTEYANKHLSNKKPIQTLRVSDSLVWILQKVPVNISEDVMFNFSGVISSGSGPWFKIPKALFKQQERVVTALMFQDNYQILPKDMHNLIDNKPVEAQLNSSIIAVALKPNVTGELSEDVTLQPRQYRSSGDKRSTLSRCVFWDYSTKTRFNGSWSSKGCRVKNGVCSCNHLTSFAILLQTDEAPPVTPENKLALEVLTYTGSGLSLLGALLSIIAYAVLLKDKYDDTQELHIRLNLLVSLAAAQITFLAGIDATDNEGVCIFVSLLLHYLFLVAFDWMLVEGLSLYFKVVKVYNTDIKTSRYYISAWGFPVPILLLSIIIASTSDKGVQSYYNQNYCWVSFTDGLVWTFVVPVIIIIVVNIVVIALVAREITKLQNVGNETVNDTRRAVRACLLLCPLLGVPWIFGLLTVTKGGLAFQYIFAILCTSQGFFIFAFHTCRNSEVKAKFHQIRQTYLSKTSSTASASHPSKVDTIET